MIKIIERQKQNDFLQNIIQKTDLQVILTTPLNIIMKY